MYRPWRHLVRRTSVQYPVNHSFHLTKRSKLIRIYFSTQHCIPRKAFNWLTPRLHITCSCGYSRRIMFYLANLLKFKNAGDEYLEKRFQYVFLITDMAYIVEASLRGKKQWYVCHANLVVWLLMAWQRNKPGQYEIWHTFGPTGIFRFQAADG